ncbi:putative superfamily III holin [Microcystis phage Me-ZS1]|nr:putative superfamily III holin [Microcystis phage Me-ZS1]
MTEQTQNAAEQVASVPNAVTLHVSYHDTVLLLMLAIIAGLLGHLMRTVERKEKVRWELAALEAASSGFVGYLAILLCKATGLSYEWTGVIVGLFGWLGATASVRLIERVVRKKLNIDGTVEDREP